MPFQIQVALLAFTLFAIGFLAGALNALNKDRHHPTSVRYSSRVPQ